MKKIFSLLFITLLVSSGFAQVDTLTPQKKVQYRIQQLQGARINALPDFAITNALKSLSDFASSRTPYLTMKELREGKADTANAVIINEGDKSGYFKYDSNNTSPDDSVFVIRNGNRRFVRDVPESISVKWWGAKGDGITDDTQAIQKALNACDLPGYVLFFPKGVYKVSNTIYLPASVRIRGANPGYRSSRYLVHSPCRIVFTKADGVLFRRNTNVGTSTDMRLQLQDIAINYNDVYFASPTVPTSATCFQDITLVSHSIVQNCQIYSFNNFFERGGIGSASRIVNNTFREIGAFFVKSGVVGDAFFQGNYFNGSVYAPDGAIAFDASNLNMSIFVENWFEFFSRAIKANNSNNNTISGNIFDYTWKPIENLGFNVTISGNVFNHVNKTEGLPKFKNLSLNAAMKTEEWICMDIKSARQGITITGNIAEAAELMINLSYADNMRDIKTQGNINVLPTEAEYNESNDRTVRFVRPSASNKFERRIVLSELMFTKHTTPPTNNLFIGRIVYVGDAQIRLNESYNWVDQSGNLFGFGGNNLLPKFDSGSWTAPNNISNVSIADDGYSISFDAATANRFYTYSIPTVPGARFLFVNGSDSLSVTGGVNTTEVIYYNSSDVQISKSVMPRKKSKLITAPENTSYITVRVGGAIATQTYKNELIQMYAYDPNSRYVIINSGSNRYRVSVGENGLITTMKVFQL